VTLAFNVIAGIVAARIYGYGSAAAANTALMLVSRGEFELILASLAVAAGLDRRVAPFAALYVLVLSILSPLFSARSFVLARWLPRRMFGPEPPLATTADPKPSEPIIEVGVIRRLGAETIEHPVRHDHAVIGAHVRDLGLPRDALVSVIVRGDEAIAPRGSTRIRAGDRLHILVRRELAKEVDALQERWRHGPIGTPPRPRRRLRGSTPIFTVRPFADDAVVGDLDAPERVLDRAVAARLRVRRDRPGALVALEDGRYAVTGPLLIAGSRDDVTTYARQRAEGADPDARAWLQTVVGALAIDIFDAAPAQRPRSKQPETPEGASPTRLTGTEWSSPERS
jgi:cell volume regulation protein A